MVVEDGIFTTETELGYEDLEDGLYLEFGFIPKEKRFVDLGDVYGEKGEKLSGPFVQLIEDSDEEITKGIKTHLYLIPDEDRKAEAEIKTPEWDLLEDYGDGYIRIEADAEIDEPFIKINGKSNIIEGLKVYLTLLNEDSDYIASGYPVNIQPDGSFDFVYTIDEKIEEAEERHLLVEFVPGDHKVETVLQHYGEEGEYLSGDLVEYGEAAKKIQLK